MKDEIFELFYSSLILTFFDFVFIQRLSCPLQDKVKFGFLDHLRGRVHLACLVFDLIFLDFSGGPHLCRTRMHFLDTCVNSTPVISNFLRRFVQNFESHDSSVRLTLLLLDCRWNIEKHVQLRQRMLDRFLFNHFFPAIPNM